MSRPAGRLSALQLRFLVLNDRPDWPVVQILVDGREAFVDLLPGWQGFDPADMLGDQSPLLPDDLGRRVAVYRCSCGIEGCGVIAPVIMPSPDGRRVSWVDFRDYVGVFAGPTAPDSDRFDGRPWPIGDLHFDRGQYIAEIRRASADRCWETARRVTARLVADGLRASDVVLPPDLRLRWVAPAWEGNGVMLSFENNRSNDGSFVQQVLSLTSDHSEPELAAQDVMDRLQAVPAREWNSRGLRSLNWADQPRSRPLSRRSARSRSVDTRRSWPCRTGRRARCGDCTPQHLACDYLFDPGDAAAENRLHADGDCQRGRGRPGSAMVTGGRVPVLWITGPAGVGKSTVSWQLFRELASSRMPVAFADADQLCMCYPAPRDDRGRDRIRARNASVVIGNYHAAGARCVIVNGVVDPALGVQRDLIEQATVLVCRLRADSGEVVRRLAGRDQRGGGVTEAVMRQVAEDCGRMDASAFADVCVDTTGVPAAQVARLVRDHCRGWPGFGAVAREPPGAAPASMARPASGTRDGTSGQMLLLCGPAGVGKSTIGFQLYLRCLRAGLTAGYIDFDQIGFLTRPADGDPGNHKLKADNLAGIWRTYHGAGARHLVMTGPIENQAVLRTYLAALPSAELTACRLHAGAAELRRRIMTRGDGGSWPQPGDPFRGQPASYLSRVAEQAVADAQALDCARIDAIRIDTDGRTAAEAANLTAAATGWPGQGRIPAIPHHTA